mmetsp:Transcript_23135/g.34254  ORF Transcript_23135/g.34254 Transcript_23135/m.34254 type:complete len:105 (+) Transcript_23135:729-1043(+)
MDLPAVSIWRFEMAWREISTKPDIRCLRMSDCRVDFTICLSDFEFRYEQAVSIEMGNGTFKLAGFPLFSLLYQGCNHAFQVYSAGSSKCPSKNMCRVECMEHHT